MDSLGCSQDGLVEHLVFVLAMLKKAGLNEFRKGSKGFFVKGSTKVAVSCVTVPRWFLGFPNALFKKFRLRDCRARFRGLITSWGSFRVRKGVRMNST